jgi:hypothetical protein
MLESRWCLAWAPVFVVIIRLAGGLVRLARAVATVFLALACSRCSTFILFRLMLCGAADSHVVHDGSIVSAEKSRQVNVACAHVGAGILL